MPIVLIGGGSRSGKSTYALVRAREMGGRLGFIATAEAHDEEMHQRIARHKQDRPAQFTTIEEPLDPASAMTKRQDEFDVIVIDCLTFWVSNLMLAQVGDLEQRFEELVSSARQARTNLILVTNEVGCGVVPDTELGRQFRDAAGRLNQLVAAAADEVHWTVFGIPMRVK